MDKKKPNVTGDIPFKGLSNWTPEMESKIDELNTRIRARFDALEIKSTLIDVEKIMKEVKESSAYLELSKSLNGDGFIIPNEMSRYRSDDGFSAPGLVYPVFELPKYFDGKGQPLLDQYIFKDNPIEDNEYFSVEVKNLPKILTVPNYEKWYRAYTIDQLTGVVEPFTPGKFVDGSQSGCTWVDHAICPDSFHDTAVANGFTYTSHTFSIVCQRWVEDRLDGDWTKLANYLPKS